MHILTISGSLRAASSNTTLLRAVAQLAPSDMTVTLYDGLGSLPHFNPDLDTDTPPSTVAAFRQQLRDADGVLICTPEYAHGLPGVLKNALDWIVSSGETEDKPFALLNASPHSTYAQGSLIEVLQTMAAVIVREASLTLPARGRKLDEAMIISDAEIADLLRNALTTFAHAIKARQKDGGKTPF